MSAKDTGVLLNGAAQMASICKSQVIAAIAEVPVLLTIAPFTAAYGTYNDGSI